MISKRSTIRWGGRLLSGWCLLATLVGAAFAPRPAHCSQTAEVAANVVPLTVDFSDTALHQTCQYLTDANLQVKSYLRSVAVQMATKSRAQLGRFFAPGVPLPDVTSLLTLGVALRL